MYALRGSDAAKGAAEAAQAAYKAAKEAGKSDDEADAAADSAGEEAAERISPKPVKQTEKDLEIGGLVGAIGGGIMGLFEACGIGRTRRPPKSEEEMAALGEAEWAKIEPLLKDPFMKQERARVNQLSDEELLEELDSATNINTRGIIIDGELRHRKMAEIKLLAFLSKQRGAPHRRNRTRKAKRSTRKSRKTRRN
jgi:ribosomal protein S13